MSNTKKLTTQPDYSPLLRVLSLAYEQAARGKGAKRHANGRDFDRQPIIEYGRIVGPGGTAFQAQKKLGEAIAHHLNERADADAAVRELLGAIVYTAATVLLIEPEGLPTIPERTLIDADLPLFNSPPPAPAPASMSVLRAVESAISPVKDDGPCVRITEQEYVRLQNIETIYNTQAEYVRNYAKCLRMVIARCSQVGSTPLSHSIITALSKVGPFSEDLQLTINALKRDERFDKMSAPPLAPLPPGTLD